jgi:hypothetical protein
MVKEEEPSYFVTNDKWLRVHGGRLDKTDKNLLKDFGKHVVVVDMAGMLDIMQKEDLEKFKEFHRDQNILHGKVLTLPELYEFASKANETMQQFGHIANLLTNTGAKLIRQWRVEEHLTWRSIARRFSKDSNQILGMALCQRAAQMCDEDFLKDPWN